MKQIFATLLLLVSMMTSVAFAQAGPTNTGWSPVTGTGPLIPVAAFVNGPIPSNFTVTAAISGNAPSAPHVQGRGRPSARTAGTSFTITVAAAPTTNPACFSYKIVN